MKKEDKENCRLCGACAERKACARGSPVDWFDCPECGEYQIMKGARIANAGEFRDALRRLRSGKAADPGIPRLSGSGIVLCSRHECAALRGG